MTIFNKRNIRKKIKATKDSYQLSESDKQPLLLDVENKLAKIKISTRLQNISTFIKAGVHGSNIPYQILQGSRNQKNMSSSPAAAAAEALGQNLQLPPLRSLDDFILGSARFQLPNLQDLEKWGNRVVKNLLYYQTNYFLMFLFVYGILIIFNPVKIICGLLVQAMLIAIFLQFFRVKPSSKGSFVASRVPAGNSQQKWYFLAGTLLFGYLLLHWFDAILLTTFTLLLPISLTFIHASLRLRNIKNKVVNTMESFAPSTPMGSFLDALNVKAESILN